MKLSVQGGDVALNNPDKLLWPDIGFTKARYVQALLELAPYLLPQETGNHEDMRCAEITDDSGHGVRVKRGAGAKPFAMSLLPYSSTMLEEALHQDELPKPRHMFLRLLAAQMGVGGDDSWMSPVHEQYQLPADQPLSLNVQLKLF